MLQSATTRHCVERFWRDICFTRLLDGQVAVMVRRNFENRFKFCSGHTQVVRSECLGCGNASRCPARYSTIRRISSKWMEKEQGRAEGANLSAFAYPAGTRKKEPLSPVRSEETA